VQRAAVSRLFGQHARKMFGGLAMLLQPEEGLAQVEMSVDVSRKPVQCPAVARDGVVAPTERLHGNAMVVVIQAVRGINRECAPEMLCGRLALSLLMGEDAQQVPRCRLFWVGLHHRLSAGLPVL